MQDDFITDKSNTAHKKVLLKLNMTPTQIMMRLDKVRLKRAQNLFQSNKGAGLDMTEFVKLLLTEVTCDEDEKLELINGAIKIFSDVDINGDGIMSWNEFVHYIVNQVDQATVTPMINPETGKMLTIEDQLALE